MSLFTLITDIPNYEDLNTLKENIKKEILNITYLENYNYNDKKDYLKIIINNKLNKIFINFYNTDIIMNFCKNVKKYNGIIKINNISLILQPDYKYFSSIKINNIDEETKIYDLYEYINSLDYINYCFLIKNLKCIYFASKYEAKVFSSKEHKLNNIVLNIEPYVFNENLLTNDKTNEEEINKNKIVNKHDVLDVYMNKELDNHKNVKEDKSNSSVNNKVVDNCGKNYDNINILYEMEKKIQEYINNLKTNIEIIENLDNNIKLDLKIKLNEIMYSVILFKNNYDDIINI